MHAKYGVSTSYGSKVIAKVKVDKRQKNTEQKQYAQDHLFLMVKLIKAWIQGRTYMLQ